MKYNMVLIAVLLTMVQICLAQKTPLVLENARYIDVEKGEVVEGVNLVIENGKIQAIGKKTEVEGRSHYYGFVQRNGLCQA